MNIQPRTYPDKLTAPVVAKTFAYHKPSAEGLVRVNALREGYSALATIVERNCPPSRERALAMTELELSAMCAIKSTVINDPASEVA